MQMDRFRQPQWQFFLQFIRPLILLFLIVVLAASAAFAQPRRTAKEGQAIQDEKGPQVSERIEVKRVSGDREIEQRLTGILTSTEWFQNVEVKVQEGVVFLEGLTESAKFRDWAGELAGNTQDVTAVVNRIQLMKRSPWDFSSATQELQTLWEGAVQAIPIFGLSVIILLLSGFASKLVTVWARRILGRRLKPLLRDVAARAIGIPIFVLGLYLVLQVAGLTRLAATVIGGAGLVGLVAGIAFRDILENFLASILISMRNPFKIGDLVGIADHLGIVRRVTTRGTVLMDFDGNHVQIPNSTIYKSIILNYTANPNRRENFEVGIGFENEVTTAQGVALAVLEGHPFVLKDPEALVLVDRLGAATVNLKVYFWYDGLTYDGLKIKSSLIRLVKRAFEQRSISMPDEAREVVFPEGIPIHKMDGKSAEKSEAPPRRPPLPVTEPVAVTTAAEGDLASEETQIKEQARRARVPEEGADLLEAGKP